MKLLFLGTGAADWDIKSPVREEGFRRFTSTLVDRILLIDPGPCVLEALDTFGVNQNGIKYIINTHSHSAHYNKETVGALEKSGAGTDSVPSICASVYAFQKVPPVTSVISTL